MRVSTPVAAIAPDMEEIVGQDAKIRGVSLGAGPPLCSIPSGSSISSAPGMLIPGS